MSLKLFYHDKTPPKTILVVADLAQHSLVVEYDPKLSRTSQPVLWLPNREQLYGYTAVIQYLARSAEARDLSGNNILATVQVDHWIDYSKHLTSGSGLQAACSEISNYLQARTFLAGHQLTVADVACWAQLQGSLQWEKLRKAGSLPHLSRWYEHISSLPELGKLANKHFPKRRPPEASSKDSKATENGQSTQTSEGSFDIGLGPEWVGKVVTRFPPEPSGFLHIGHAKALILNQQIAAANNGRMLVRFDDTNPDKEKDVFVDSILADAKRLGASVDKVTHTSDYFPQMLDLAERLIKAGHLYADDTTQEKMKEERLAKQPSSRRDRSTEESLRIWQEMVKGSKEGFQNCLRFKIDPSSDNGTLRDPVAYRCNETPHLRTATQYKVYPTYDCACPFVDALEGVTHALRTSEYRDREEQFYRILRMQQQVWPGLPNVAVWDYSRLSFVNTVLSKRKLTRLVNMGAVEGWDDPRMPTVQGLLRRGLTVPALREFILAQGASKNVTLQEWDKIWTINKKVIDPVCPRHTAVKAEGRVLLKLSDVTQQDYVTVDRHKKYPGAGKKSTMRSGEIWLDQEDAAVLKEGEEVTLMDWGNAIIQRVERSSSGLVTGMQGVTHLEGSVKSTKWKLTWLAESAELLPLSLVDFDHLISKKKLEEDDQIEDLVTLCSRWETAALGDSNMRTLGRGEIIQLERKGYFCVDEPYVRPGKPMLLLAIPDGRSKTVVKPEAAVKAAFAAHQTALETAAAANKAAAESAAIKGKANANGNPAAKSSKAESLGAAIKPKEGVSSAAKFPETSDTPVTSKVSVPVTSKQPQASSSRSTGGPFPGKPTKTPSTPHPAAAVASQPIPVPTRGTPLAKIPGPGRVLSVPPTPTNTPQNVLPLPPQHSSLRSLHTAVALASKLQLGAEDTLGQTLENLPTPHNTPQTLPVPPTPHNTPQSSIDYRHPPRELAAHPSPLGRGLPFPKP